ncbi:hypothetical protein BKA93DRAFT_817119 [Sparassis latifolia]
MSRSAFISTYSASVASRQPSDIRRDWSDRGATCNEADATMQRVSIMADSTKSGYPVVPSTTTLIITTMNAGTSPSPSASSSSTESVDAGCALLQAIREEVRIGRYPTTGGEYLEAIFTHREVFSAYPQGHRMCSVGFSDLAQDLEQRSGRADRDADPEAVAAFRHEAAWIAAVGW